MNFIDEITIYLKSGNGGNGVSSFRRSKFIRKGGPDGGNGGNGGDIIFESVRQLSSLIDFKYQRHFTASHGESGKKSNRTGKSANPLIIKVPLGTQVFNNNVCLHDFTKEEQFKILDGGVGGFGNVNFKSSISQTPKFSTSGEKGKELSVDLKLKLISNVSIIGLPNTGKSSLLKNISRSNPRIADYPFSTTSPSIGTIYDEMGEDITILDIPALTAESHLSKGLGNKFLKHIERSELLIYLLDATSNNIKMDYYTIREELEFYQKSLSNKKTMICLSKCDAITKDKLDKILTELQISKIYPIFKNREGIDYLLDAIISELR